MSGRGQDAVVTEDAARSKLGRPFPPNGKNSLPCRFEVKKHRCVSFATSIYAEDVCAVAFGLSNEA
jgi:hypothetical protein